MLSSATTTPSSSSTARLEALRKQFDKKEFFELKDSSLGSEFYSMELIEKKFKEIDDEEDPIAAMILLRELYKNLELSAMGIVRLMRTSVPREFIKVPAEYQRVEAACDSVITFPMTICKIVNVDTFSIAFPTDHYDQTESEKILKKNIFTRFIDIDKVAIELLNTCMGHNKEKIMKRCNALYLKVLDDVMFIQSELLSILKAQSTNESRIVGHIKKSKKGLLEKHYDQIFSYYHDHKHSTYMNSDLIARLNYLSKSAGSKAEKTEFCQLLVTLICCEIYTLDAIRDHHKSITGIETFIYLSDKPDIEYLARYYPQVGKDKTEAEMNRRKEYFSQRITQEKIETTLEALSTLDRHNLTRLMIISERGILNNIIMLSMMTHQINNDIEAEVLPTPRTNDLIKCLRKKKKQENAAASNSASSSASSSSSSSSGNTSNSSSESEYEAEVKDKVITEKYLITCLRSFKYKIDELQQLYLHIYKNSALLTIVQRNNEELQLQEFENKIINKLEPMYKKFNLDIQAAPATEYATIYHKMDIAFIGIKSEIEALSTYIKHLEHFAEKAARITKTEQIKQTLEKKAQEKARELKLEEQKRLEAKAEKPIKTKRPAQAPVEAKPLPVSKHVKPASRPTADDKQPQLNEIRLLHLDQACKNIMYIRLILGVNDLDKDVKHFALFYNIFRCFQSLKLYQEAGGMKNTFNPDEIVNLRNMIMHHGINAVCEESVEEFAETIVGNLPQALSGLRKNELFRNNLDSESRQALIQEFGLLERGSMPYVSYFNHARLVIENTPLYTKLKKFHEAKINNDTTAEYTQDVTNSYVPLMKKMIASISKTTSLQTYIRIDLFINNHFFELQALRMLAIICGELINNTPRSNNAFDDFRQYCRHSVRNVAGHAMVDMDTPLGFFNALKISVERLDGKQTSLVVSQAPAALFTPQVPDEKKPQEDLSLQSLKLN